MHFCLDGETIHHWGDVTIQYCNVQNPSIHKHAKYHLQEQLYEILLNYSILFWKKIQNVCTLKIRQNETQDGYA